MGILVILFPYIAVCIGCISYKLNMKLWNFILGDP